MVYNEPNRRETRSITCTHGDREQIFLFLGRSDDFFFYNFLFASANRAHQSQPAIMFVKKLGGIVQRVRANNLTAGVQTGQTFNPILGIAARNASQHTQSRSADGERERGVI